MARSVQRTQLYRHPSDVARLVFAASLLGLLLLAEAVQQNELSGLTVDLLALVDGLPKALVNALVGLVQLLTLVVPIAVAAGLVRARQWTLLSLLGLSALLAAVSMVLLADLVDEGIPFDQLGVDRVDSWFIGGQYPSSTYLAALTACLVTGSPWMRRSWRRAGWIFVAFVMAARTLSATEVPIRNLLLLAVGAAVGSLALVVFGAPRRRVDAAAVESALTERGVDVVDFAARGTEGGVPTFVATSGGGEGRFVKVLGRDQRDSNLLLRVWRRLTLKDVGRAAPSSPRRAVEHEALALGIVGVAANTPRALHVLETDDEAAVLVTDLVDGTPLSELDEIADDTLAAIWAQVAEMQQRRLAHGSLDLSSMILESDGRVVLVDLGDSVLDAGDNTLGIDVAELLAASALAVGTERAVAVASAALPREVLERAVPLLQPAVLSRPVRQAFKERGDELDELRDAAADAVGIEKVTTAEVRRLTVGGVVSLVGSIVLVGYVVNLASNWEDTWDAFTSADLVYVIPVVVMAMSTYFTGATSLIGAVTIDLAYLRTVAVMFGQSYLNRFTPANAGGMAMRVRYLQLNGVDTAVAASSIALTSAASGIAQVVVMLVFLIWGGSSDRLSDFEMPNMGTIVIVILVVGLVVWLIMASRLGRTVIKPWATTAWSKVRESIGDLVQRPAKLAQLFGGALLGKIANIVAFWASCAAFGADISFPKAGALYIIATTIGSAVPTPGGVGGVEAALTAALIAYGVDNASAAAIVLFFRTLTFWLPTLPGYGFFRYTQAKGIV